MPELRFDIEEIDPILKNQALNSEKTSVPGVTFQKQGEIDFILQPNTFLGESTLNTRMTELVKSLAEKANGYPLGVCEFEDVFVIGPLGLILDWKNRVCWRGDLIGWTLSGVHGFAVHPKIRRHGAHRLFINPAIFDDVDTYDSSIVWSAPGFGVYGHWLIDYLPRMLRVERNFEPGMNLYYRSVEGWGERLCKTLGFNLIDSFESQSGREVSYHQRLVVPSFIRRHKVIQKQASTEAWAEIAKRIKKHKVEKLPEKFGNKLYVSRRNWKKGLKKEMHNRALHNAAEVEERVRKAGFNVVYPETLSLAQQHKIFADAKIVFGEDGSGLHNSIFSAPGTRVGIVHMGKDNMFHAMIANNLGQSVGYYDSTALDEKAPFADRTVSMAQVDRAIDELCATRI